MILYLSVTIGSVPPGCIMAYYSARVSSSVETVSDETSLSVSNIVGNNFGSMCFLFLLMRQKQQIEIKQEISKPRGPLIQPMQIKQHKQFLWHYFFSTFFSSLLYFLSSCSSIISYNFLFFYF